MAVALAFAGNAPESRIDPELAGQQPQD